MVAKFVHIIIFIIIWFIYPLASAQGPPITRPGCNSTCGDRPIPYPFGMNDPKCYADKWFEIECRNSTTPYLKYIDVEVTYFDVTRGMVWIRNPIFRRNCKSKEDVWPVKNLGGGPFVYSQDYNKFVAVGCNNIAFLQSQGSDVSGCVSICDDNKPDISIIDLALETDCNGRYCCETTLPSYLREYNATIEGLRENNIQCSYAFILGEYRSSYNDNYFYNFTGVSDLKRLNDVAAILEWEIPNNLTTTLKLPADRYATCEGTNITSSKDRHSGQRCYCIRGFDGNPYIAGGCTDIIPVSTQIFF